MMTSSGGVTGVIGLGQLGRAVACYLADHGAEVIAVDSQMERVEEIKDRVQSAQCLDATSERALRAAGMIDCDTVVLALGEDQLEQAVLATMALRQLGVGQIISRAASSVQARVLEKIGVSRVIFPERDIGEQLARHILTPGVVQLSPLGDGVSFAELHAPDFSLGKTIGELEIRRRFGVSVVAIKQLRDSARDDGTVERDWQIERRPGPASLIDTNDRLIVVGTDDAIRQFAQA